MVGGGGCTVGGGSCCCCWKKRPPYGVEAATALDFGFFFKNKISSTNAATANTTATMLTMMMVFREALPEAEEAFRLEGPGVPVCTDELLSLSLLLLRL